MAGPTTRGEALLCRVDHEAQESQPVAWLGGCGEARRERLGAERARHSYVLVFPWLILAFRLQQQVLGSVVGRKHFDAYV